MRFLWTDSFCNFRDPAGRITHSADLKMASLLVQAGADPSCGLTDLLEFHINLVKDDGKVPDDCSDMPLYQKFTVGLGGKIGLSRKQLIADTRALLEQFIDKGLDVNESVGHPSKFLSNFSRHSK